MFYISSLSGFMAVFRVAWSVLRSPLEQSLPDLDLRVVGGAETTFRMPLGWTSQQRGRPSLRSMSPMPEHAPLPAEPDTCPAGRFVLAGLVTADGLLIGLVLPTVPLMPAAAAVADISSRMLSGGAGGTSSTQSEPTLHAKTRPPLGTRQISSSPRRGA